jgi:uncharacterized protein
MIHFPAIEIRGFKWPNRPTSVAVASLLGDDIFGEWLGIARGDSWWSADRTRTGLFDHSFVKLVPGQTFWTVCFHTMDPLIDVDIVLPVRRYDGVIEEVDLELDVLRTADGRVCVRDQDIFDQMRSDGTLPDDVAAKAQATCEEIRLRVESGSEPFGKVGETWLSQFVRDSGREDNHRLRGA